MFARTSSDHVSIDCAYPSYLNVTIPKSHLGYQTNNQYNEFPPMMADGRSLISSWTPDATINEGLIQHNQIRSNWQYRKFLQSNAAGLREYNFRETANDTGHVAIAGSSRASTVVSGEEGNQTHPYMYQSFTDQTRPNGYESSDLKEVYLVKEQTNSRKVAPYFVANDFPGAVKH